MDLILLSARRPIQPIYIRNLVRFIHAVWEKSA